MDRVERVVRHGSFCIISTAAKVFQRNAKRDMWDVLVSVARLGSNVGALDPVMLNLEPRLWPDPERAIDEAVDVAKRRIDANDPALIHR
jgi:hypothetical protein